jgi:hypothetical protein
MRRLKAATAVLCATVAAVVGGGTAHAAGPGNSDAAHMCLDGPQIDEYYVGDQSGQEAAVDFGSLVHGVGSIGGLPIAENSAWVQTESHGQCVSFFAAAKKGTRSGGKPKPADIVFTHTYDKSSPIILQ